MTVPKDSEKYQEYIKKLSDAQKRRYEKPEEHKKISDAHKGLKYPNKKPVTEETRLKQRIAHLGKTLPEGQRKKIGISNLGKKHPPRTEEYREKQRITHLGKPNPNKGKSLWTLEQRKLIGEKQKGKKLTLEHRMNISKGNKGRIHTPECRAKISKTLKEDMNTREMRIGGFWYGNVRYPEKKYYCELWTPELCDRIRAAWDYKSAISGKTSTDNNGKKLDCHHVYFQKKACCEWDEDRQGYYAMINIGTFQKPNIIRYDIKGDPNKFVPLTHAEHGMMKSDKLKWIHFFEDLIEKHNGYCYVPKPE